VELCEETRRLARLGEHDDGLGGDVARGLDGRRCDRLRLGHARLGLLGRLHEAEDAVVPGGVLCGHHGLRLDAGARHDLNGRLGERSVRGLS